MAGPKKNALYQQLFPMVDSVDFATVKSALTNPPTGKFFGVNHGGSAAATSGTLSKVMSHVHSGIYRMTAKAAETNYDQVLFSIKQPSCADQNIPVNFADNDDSDIASQLLVIQSLASDAASAAIQANSRVLLTQSLASDAASAAQQANSRVALTQSIASDVFSQVSDIRSQLIAGTFALGGSNLSDIGSRVWVDAIGARVDSRIQLIQSAASDTLSMVTANSGILSDILSAVSDMQSDFQSRVPKLVATNSQVSDLVSDVKSAVTIVQSMASDAASAAQQANSRVLLNASAISDIYSMLSDTQSDFQSRVPKLVATNSQVSDLVSDLKSAVTVVQSLASDAASAAQQANSRVLLNQSSLSDVYSMLSDMQSDFQSRVPKLVATNSQLSDVASDLRSLLVTTGVTIGASSLSDLRSAIADAASAVFSHSFSEPVSAPDFNASYEEWLAYWAATSINKITQTSTVRKLRNAADNSTITSFVVSDDATTFIDGAAG